MYQDIQVLNIYSATVCLKKGEILLSFIDSKKTYFALKKEKVLIQNSSTSFTLSIDEFEELYSSTKFIIYDPSIEVEIDSLKDDEYYSWNVLKY